MEKDFTLNNTKTRSDFTRMRYVPEGRSKQNDRVEGLACQHFDILLEFATYATTLIALSKSVCEVMACTDMIMARLQQKTVDNRCIE